MNIRIIDVQHGVEKALEALMAGDLVAIPTETVYGLAADATDQDAVLKIFAAKNRPADNPLICHVSDVDMAKEYAELPEEFYTLAAAFWPGPLTMFVREGQGISPSVRAGTGKVSFRMPNHPQVLELIRAFGRPLAAPSANKSGRPSGTSALHVAQDFTEEEVPLILDGGMCQVGIESTILDLTPLSEGKPALLVREGHIALEELCVFVPVRHVTELEEGMTVSPGLKHRHYAPQGELRLFEGTPDHMSTDMLAAYKEGAVIIAASEQIHELQKTAAMILDGGPWAEPAVAAKRFYDLLRLCDEQGAETILCATWPTESGIGRALRQRQKKAAGLI